MTGLVITIDGTASSGKSTLGRRIARRIGYRYIDSGAMYRAVGLAAIQRSINLEDGEALAGLARSVDIQIEERDGEQRILLDGVDVSAQIRSPEVGGAASGVGIIPAVRAAMVEHQRRMGERGGIVMEGRDIGTVVFPEAEVKFYIDAVIGVRARRRRKEQRERGMDQPLEQVEEQLRLRDHRDSTRSDSPLRPAPDAIVIDTSHRSLNELEAEMIGVIEKRSASKE